MDAGQVFSGLRQVNKELLGLQRTQERFNQLAVPKVLTQEQLAAAKEMLKTLTEQIAVQQQILINAQNQVRTDQERVTSIRTLLREETSQRTASINALREQVAIRIQIERAQLNFTKATANTIKSEEDNLRVLKEQNAQKRIGLEESRRAVDVFRKQAEVEITERERILALDKEELVLRAQTGTRQRRPGEATGNLRERVELEQRQIEVERKTLAERNARQRDQDLTQVQAISRETEKISTTERSLQQRRADNTREVQRQAEVLAKTRSDGAKAIFEENRGLQLSQEAGRRALNDALRTLGLSKEQARVAVQALRTSQEQEAATSRNTQATERATEAERKRAVIAENIRDAILALGFGSALQNLNRFAAESALLAARVENLGTVLRTVGTVAGNSLGQLNLFEGQVKSLGITTQATRQVLTLLAANQQDLSQSAQLARIAQDAAAIAGINSSEAAERLVVATERLDTRLLRSLGIVINLREVYAKFARETGRAAETLSAAEKQQLLYNAVIERGANIQGTYEASLKDSFKQFTSLERITQEARREYGERFVPVFQDYVSVLNFAIGTDDEHGLRGINKHSGAGIAATQAFATAAGTAALAALGLSRAYQLLNVGAVVAAVRTASVASALALALNPITVAAVALGSLAAAYVYLGAKAREAEQAQKAVFEAISVDATKGAELQAAVDTVNELGNVTSRTVAQQEEFTRALRIVSGILPDYSAKLRAAEGDVAAYNKVLTEAGAQLGIINEESANFKNKVAADLGTAIVALLSKAQKSFRAEGNLGQRSAKRELRETFGISDEDLDALSGKSQDAGKQIAALGKVAQASGEESAKLGNALREALNIDLEGTSFFALVDEFRKASVEAKSVRSAIDAIVSQKFQRDLARQSAASDVFSEEIKRQRTESKQALQGTAAEEIDQFVRIGEAAAVRFKTEKELREGAEAGRRVAIAAAEAESRLDIDILKAKITAEKDDNEKKVLGLQLLKAENNLLARKNQAEREVIQIVEEGLAQQKERDRALAVANARIDRTVALAKEQVKAEQELQRVQATGIKARAAGRPAAEIAQQVEQTGRLISLVSDREGIQKKIKTIEEETGVELQKQLDLLNQLVNQHKPENQAQILELEKLITKERESSVVAVQQLNLELKKSQQEVQKLAQDQLDDLKTLQQGFQDAKKAREDFDSPTTASKRQLDQQHALTEERIRLENAGASQAVVEESLNRLAAQQADEEAKKRAELEKTERVEQQRSRGAGREQQQIERALQAQGIRTRRTPPSNPFAEEKNLRTEETNRLLGLLQPGAKGKAGILDLGGRGLALDVSTQAIIEVQKSKADFANQVTDLRNVLGEAAVNDVNLFNAFDGLIGDTKSRFEKLNSRIDDIVGLLRAEATRNKNAAAILPKVGRSTN